MKNFLTSQKKIGIIGLGYVGLPLAIEFGISNYVIGYDISKKRINQLNFHKDDTLQVTKKEFLKSKFLKFSSKEKDIQDCNIYIITVPTPVNKKNKPDLSKIINATKLVGKMLTENNFVIYESTVYPGATEEICKPILEKYSNLKCAIDDKSKGCFYIGYSPERINPGDKKHKIKDIVKITSGCTKQSSKLINNLYSEIITAGTHQASSIKVAEAAKVIENTQRDLNVGFINELSQIFTSMDIDTLEVLKAASTKWNFINLLPGLVGGHCIGVDPYYLTYKANQIGNKTKIITAGRSINNEMSKFFVNKIVKRLKINKISVKKLNIAILGITFKENCNDMRNSKVIEMINFFKKKGANIYVCDPLANKKISYRDYGLKLIDFDKISNVNLICLNVPHIQFKKLPLSKFKSMCSQKFKPTFFDLKGVFNKESLSKIGFDVIRP